VFTRGPYIYLGTVSSLLWTTASVPSPPSVRGWLHDPGCHCIGFSPGRRPSLAVRYICTHRRSLRAFCCTSYAMPVGPSTVSRPTPEAPDAVHTADCAHQGSWMPRGRRRACASRIKYLLCVSKLSEEGLLASRREPPFPSALPPSLVPLILYHHASPAARVFLGTIPRTVRGTRCIPGGSLDICTTSPRAKDLSSCC
jgi:hypothetical protein